MASAFTRMSYFSVASEDEEVDVEGLAGNDGGESNSDGRTPLDKTIDRIGMGWYQWTLLSLCGFGWMADNMWIQAVAIVLPRVQEHFSVRDGYIGTLSSSMFAGMMVGALGWGTCADLMGRTTAFNATLFLTSIFGVLASLANSFIWLCTALFFLGSAVGGSMPTDGTLLLEHMPNGKQYLVTALSVFFSFGSVLAAIVGLFVIPGHSCPSAPIPCDVTSQNTGWKYLLSTLGMITLSMFLARIVFFRLHESPRYLVHAGRPQEAVESLQLIARFNGDELFLGLDDVQDHLYAPNQPSPGASGASDVRPPVVAQDREPVVTAVLDVDQEDELHQERSSVSSQRSHDILRASPDAEAKNYSSTGESNVPLDSHTFNTPTLAQDPHRMSTYSTDSPRLDGSTDDLKEPVFPRSSVYTIPASGRPISQASYSTRASRSRSRILESSSRRLSTASSFYEAKSKLYWMLPRWLRRPLWAWLDRVAMVLSPEWVRTTTLMCAVWFSMSLAYTMFNVYLPKLLETRTGSHDQGDGSKSLTDSLWDVVIYALGGCPGAILGAYLIDSPLGRRWSLAGSTFVTAFFCAIFVLVEQSWAVRASTVGISLSATAMWAVLYGWTPEIFGTKVRGTACGIASALSRIGGMIAPMLGGTLLTIDHSIPVYTSIVVFVVAGVCVLLLDEKEGERGGERVIVH